MIKNCQLLLKALIIINFINSKLKTLIFTNYISNSLNI